MFKIRDDAASLSVKCAMVDESQVRTYGDFFADLPLGTLGAGALSVRSRSSRARHRNDPERSLRRIDENWQTIISSVHMSIGILAGERAKASATGTELARVVRRRSRTRLGAPLGPSVQMNG